MSLIRAVARLTAVAALRGKTWAHDMVFDSSNTPMVEALKDATKPIPYITIYTDTDNRNNPSGDDVYNIDRQLGLVVEISVASGVRETSNGFEIVLPHTDAAMELVIDMVETQVFRILFGDPRDEWGELLKRMTNNVVRVPTLRGGRGGAGIRFAARQCIFVLDTIDDTPAGIVLDDDHVIKQFIAKAQALPADDDLHHAADIISSMLDTEPYASWEQAQAWLGLTRRGIIATGTAPLRELLPGTTPEPDGALVVRPAPDREGPLLEEIALWQEDMDTEFDIDPHTPADVNAP